MKTKDKLDGTWYINVYVNGKNWFLGREFAWGKYPGPLNKQDAFIQLQALIKEEELDVVDYDNLTMELELYFTKEGSTLYSESKTYKLF